MIGSETHLGHIAIWICFDSLIENWSSMSSSDIVYLETVFDAEYNNCVAIFTKPALKIIDRHLQA